MQSPEYKTEPPEEIADIPGTEIHDLIGRLPKESPIREWAMGLLIGITPPEESIPVFIEILERQPGGLWWNLSTLRLWREQAVAAWALGQVSLTPEQTDAAVTALVRMLWRTPSDKNSLLRAGLVSVVLGLITAVFGGLIAVFARFFPTAAFMTLVVIVCGWVVSLTQCTQVEHNHQRVVQRFAAISLGKLPTLLSIEALIATALETGLGLRGVARETLVRVLPELTSAYYGHLRPLTVPNLCRLLQSGGPALVKQVLIALGKVGDGRALRPVEALAKQQNGSPLRNIIEEVLPILQERKRMEDAPRNLLRASDQPFATLEVLLRPAMDTGEAQPEQLLRTAITTDSDAPSR
ncbi:MAG TPA: hypothetical protein VKU00_11615 [Chthonomonadaceae bacterium]|nr:hypothetical protein [Chthonomonadaceae bacterium]